VYYGGISEYSAASALAMGVSAASLFDQHQCGVAIWLQAADVTDF
jgi:hypothetical protein